MDPQANDSNSLFLIKDHLGTTREMQFAESEDMALARYAVSVCVPSGTLKQAGWIAVKQKEGTE